MTASRTSRDGWTAVALWLFVMLKVLRGVGDGNSGAGGEILDRAITLRQMLEQLKAMAMGHGLGDLGKGVIQRLLRTHYNFSSFN